MLRRQSGIILAVHQAIDLVIVAGCFIAAYGTRLGFTEDMGTLGMNTNYRMLLLLAVISFHISLRLFGVYEPYRRHPLRKILSRVFKGTLTGTAGIIFLGYIMHLDAVSRLLVALFFSYSLVALVLFKTVLYKVLARSRARDYNTRSILVIGSRQRALEFIKAVRRRRGSGYRIRGCLETEDQAELVGDRVY